MCDRPGGVSVWMMDVCLCVAIAAGGFFVVLHAIYALHLVDRIHFPKCA